MRSGFCRHENTKGTKARKAFLSWVSCLRAFVVLIYMLLPGWPGPLAAQAPRELGIGALTLIRDSSLVGGAVYGALRISPRTRLALAGGLGGGPGGLGG